MIEHMNLKKIKYFQTKTTTRVFFEDELIDNQRNGKLHLRIILLPELVDLRSHFLVHNMKQKTAIKTALKNFSSKE